MENIELYQWWRCGKLDGDGYETDYEVSDEDYNIIVNLVKKYSDENGVADEGGIDYIEFTEEYFYNNAPELYQKIYDNIVKELIATTAETAECWFDEEDEGCTIEEYLEDNYDFGFYFTEGFLTSIV